MLASCNKDEADAVRVTSETIDFSSDGGSSNIDIHADAKSWNIDNPGSDWLKLSVTNREPTHYTC